MGSSVLSLSKGVGYPVVRPIHPGRRCDGPQQPFLTLSVRGFAPLRAGNTEFMNNQDSGTNPSEATRAQEETEAAAAHKADRPPTGEEEKAAPTKASPESERDFKEMAKRGAEVEGEGQIP